MKVHQDISVAEIELLYLDTKEYHELTGRDCIADLILYSELNDLYDYWYSMPDQEIWMLSPSNVLTVIHENEVVFNAYDEFLTVELISYMKREGFMKYKKDCTPEELSEYNDEYGIVE